MGCPTEPRAYLVVGTRALRRQLLPEGLLIAHPERRMLLDELPVPVLRNEAMKWHQTIIPSTRHTGVHLGRGRTTRPPEFRGAIMAI